VAAANHLWSNRHDKINTEDTAFLFYVSGCRVRICISRRWELIGVCRRIAWLVLA